MNASMLYQVTFSTRWQRAEERYQRPKFIISWRDGNRILTILRYQWRQLFALMQSVLGLS